MWNGIVTASELVKAIGNPELRLMDCRHQLTNPHWGPQQYAAGHLPGAVHAHIDRDLSSPPTARTGRHPLPDPAVFCEKLGRWGIDEHVQVVAYDDQGGIWAARAWWLLQDYGHRAAAVLDGGIQGWTGAGGPLTPEPPTIAPTTFRGAPGHRPQLDAQTLRDALGSGHMVALDARAPERYRGHTEPIDPVAGHIPGARNLPAMSLVTDEQKFLPPDRLRETLQRAARGRPPQEIAAYCGSGVTASHVVLAFDVAGLGPISLYPGSWSEWIRDPSRPIATGEEPADKARTAHV